MRVVLARPVERGGGGNWARKRMRTRVFTRENENDGEMLMDQGLLAFEFFGPWEGFFIHRIRIDEDQTVS